MEAGGAEVLDELDLTLGITCSSRNGHSAKPLCTILEAQTACEHTVATGVLEHIALTTAHHIKVTGNHISPRTDVVLRIDDDARIARSTTGGVDADSIVEVAAYETKRIVVTKVLLCCKRNLTKIVERIDGISCDTMLTQTLLVERRLQGDVDALLQFLYLQLLKLLSWHRL